MIEIVLLNLSPVVLVGESWGNIDKTVPFSSPLRF